MLRFSPAIISNTQFFCLKNLGNDKLSAGRDANRDRPGVASSDLERAVLTKFRAKALLPVCLNNKARKSGAAERKPCQPYRRIYIFSGLRLTPAFLYF